ncbi:MAG: hypothetical protein NC397_05880 [Clostridium sp.]|nr:hypothetical protein [Clostridium sp.]
MKKGRVTEEKQVNIFIICFIVFLVLIIGFVVFMVHHSKGNAEENLSSTKTSSSYTSSLSKTQNESVTDDEKEAASNDDRTVKTTERTTENSVVTDSPKNEKNSPASSNNDAENERYRKECDKINETYDNIIKNDEAVIRVFEKSKKEDEDKLALMQNELDNMKASGASQTALEDYQLQMNIVQSRVDNFQKDIEEYNKEIEKAKADKAAKLAEAEKKHQANLK